MAFDGLEWPKLTTRALASDLMLVVGDDLSIAIQPKYARLFAAAPEMYAMLERITRHGRPEWGECPSDKAVGVQCQGCEWSRLKATIDGEK